MGPVEEMENMGAKSLTDAGQGTILSGAGGSNFLTRETVTKNRNY